MRWEGTGSGLLRWGEYGAAEADWAERPVTNSSAVLSGLRPGNVYLVQLRQIDGTASPIAALRLPDAAITSAPGVLHITVFVLPALAALFLLLSAAFCFAYRKKSF